jgi:hypothetical protein
MTLKLERAWSNRPYFHSEPSKGDVSQRVAAIFAMEDRHRRMCQLNVTEVNAPTLTLDSSRNAPSQFFAGRAWNSVVRL